MHDHEQAVRKEKKTPQKRQIMPPPNRPTKPGKGKKQSPSSSHQQQQQQQSRNSANKKRLERKNPQRIERRTGKDDDDNNNDRTEEVDETRINLSKKISPDLQQLLLNVFKYALTANDESLSSAAAAAVGIGAGASADAGKRDVDEAEGYDNLNTQIQTLKTHLFNRDFESAFADASPSLLRAYALRWSASRGLAYVGLFWGVLEWIMSFLTETGGEKEDEDERKDLGVLCIGGGAGAEIVALAAAWRVICEESFGSREGKSPVKDVAENMPPAAERDATEESVSIEKLTLYEKNEQEQQHLESTLSKAEIYHKAKKRKLAITAVDIAEWSDVIHRLDNSIHSAHVPSGSKTCSTPMIHTENAVDITFKHLDILSLPEDGLKSLLSSEPSEGDVKKRNANLISLMFTLNELFSTSISKTTQLLLRLTDLSSPGTVLLVVDSPGSYSTLSFSKNPNESTPSSEKQQKQQRQYPMKFLLDHTLLTVAEGAWDKVVTQDSRWFRRDANSRLHYNVDLEGGQGFIKLEDMRFQIHVYRRLPSSQKKKEDGTDKVKRS